MPVYGSFGKVIDNDEPDWTSRERPGGRLHTDDVSLASDSTPRSNWISLHGLYMALMSVTPAGVTHVIENMVLASRSQRPRNFAAGPSLGPLELPPQPASRPAATRARARGCSFA